MENKLFPPAPGQLRNSYLLVFGSLWCIIFVLYLPAARGGWVLDVVTSLTKLKHITFWEYINIKERRGNTYQFSNAAIYLIYQLFGTHRWLWHLLFITLQATNATLLFIICLKLFDASGVKNGFAIAAGSIILFCICPHISEVVVWKACYHNLHAMFIMLCILYCVQKFQSVPSAKYAWFAGILFLFSTISDEYFFLSIALVAALIVYYHIGLGNSKIFFRKTLLYFFFPLFILVLFRVALPYLFSGSYASDAGDELHQPLTSYLRKPPLYLFHIVFFGRFFPPEKKQWVYDFFSNNRGLILFYGLLICVWIYIFARFRMMATSEKVFVLIFTWMLMCMAMVSPVWFPETLLVNFDRYAYFMLPFIYMLLLYFLSKLKFHKQAIAIFMAYALINVYCTLKVNKCWYQSARIADHLLQGVPAADDKTVLLLNVPEYMKGVPVIFSFGEMYNLFNERPINNMMYDVVSYNMIGKDDGAHVTVLNDSVLHITLNQWGTWWWTGMRGASSYENINYRFSLVDPGHWYELTLKHPESQYLLLYEVGDKFKIVDMSRKNEDQY